MAEQDSTTSALVIAEIPILQDQFGRYNLNLLFQASAAPENKRPGHWLKRKTSQALINELDSQMSFSTIDVVKGGDHGGTYVHELLAVSYAGWISPAFQLKVNQAFLDMRRPQPLPQPLPDTYQDQLAKIQAYRELVESLGLFEDRDRLMLKDLARTLLPRALGMAPALPGQRLLAEPAGFFLADRLRTLGYSLTRKQEAALLGGGLAKAVATKYRETHNGHSPLQSARYVDGAVRQVNWYHEETAPWIDDMIHTWCARQGISA